MHCEPLVDFAFLAAQTFRDPDLEREILDVFLAQSRSAVPLLVDLSEREQNDLAHRLKGSCLGIGARAAAAAAQAFEDAPCENRSQAHEHLIAAFAATEAAILAHLAERGWSNGGPTAAAR